MALTQAQITALYTTLKARFNLGLQAAPNHWEQVAMKIASESNSNTYAWLTQFPAFREWVGSRLHKVVAEQAYTVVNKKFENTIDIPRTAIEDNQFGQYGDIAYSYGLSVVDLFNDLIFQALNNGFSSVCYDGQYFIDTDHPVYPNEDGTGTPVSVSNYQAGAGSPWFLLCTERAPKPIYLQNRLDPVLESQTAGDNVFNYDVYSYGGRWRGNAAYGFWQLAYGSKAALTEANFAAAFLAMESQVGDGNRKLGITPDLLVCGPANRLTAEKLLKAERDAAGATNINYNKVKLLVSPWIG